MEELGASEPPILGINPYPPGSDSWHKHNLGLPINSIGVTGSVEMTSEGLLVQGWFYGDVPPSLVSWHVDMRNGFALTHGEVVK